MFLHVRAETKGLPVSASRHRSSARQLGLPLCIACLRRESHYTHETSRDLRANSQTARRGGLGAQQGNGGSAGPAVPPGARPAWLAPGTAFGDVNQKLCQYVKPFELAGMTVEPFMLLVAAFCTFLFGPRGLLLAALGFFVVSRNS